jgi:hypothetical protein
MKFQWESKDIKPGRKFGRVGIDEIWMIGYLVEAGYTRYVSVSMSDGMVATPSCNKENMASFLTENRYEPIEFMEK